MRIGTLTTSRCQSHLIYTNYCYQSTLYVDWLSARRRQRKIGIIGSSFCLSIPATYTLLSSLSLNIENNFDVNQRDGANAAILLIIALLTFILAIAVAFTKDDKNKKNDTAGRDVYNVSSVLSIRSNIDVRSTGDAHKGRGAFAMTEIPKGSCLGDYDGELLDTKQFYDRYSNNDNDSDSNSVVHKSGIGEYCIRVDDDFVIDGKQLATERAYNNNYYHFRSINNNKKKKKKNGDEDYMYFTPAHINHSSSQYNVARKVLKRQRRVVFYTTREIHEGEELLLDYGKQYWKGREHLIID